MDFIQILGVIIGVVLAGVLPVILLGVFGFPLSLAFVVTLLVVLSVAALTKLAVWGKIIVEHAVGIED